MKLMEHPFLPVESFLPQIVQAVDSAGTLLLSAEPGAGKSTIVPLAFLEKDWKKIIMLEPRRIAARASAARMAQLLGEKVGQTVGYRTGTESCCSASTRIEVVTEAILTRMLQHDPELPGVGLIIFDEFHERSIHADLGLALSLDVRENLRSDLNILIMSATLDLPSLKKLLPDAAELHVPGRMFPVRTIYSDVAPDQPLEKRMALTIRNALKSFEGDLLAFLPGEGEILRTMSELQKDTYFSGNTAIAVLPLYGNLPADRQDQVFVRKDGIRRVILSTAIAETSLTIDGVRIVVDSGLMRVPRFSPGTGMDHLETLPLPLSGAEQRRGRAGRTAEGVCIRLWSEIAERSFEAHRPPEILVTDLCELTLELLNWGVAPANVSSLPFPDLPPAAALQQAYTLLQDLGCDDSAYAKRLLDLPVHPRLAHMILKSAEISAQAAETAVKIAAILSEKDFLRSAPSADLSLRLESFHKNHGDHAALFRVRQTADRIRSVMKLKKQDPANDDFHTFLHAGQLLAYACPDRIARRRPQFQNQYILANGVVAELNGNDPLTQSSFLVVGETSTLNGKTRIHLASPLTEDVLRKEFAHRITERFETNWDAGSKCVRAQSVHAIGSLVLDRKNVADPPEDVLLSAFLEGIRKSGFSALGLSKNELAFRQRVTFLHRQGLEEYPDFSEEGLMSTLEDWLAPYVTGMKKLDDLRKLDYRMILETFVPVPARLAMRDLAPEKLTVPSGSQIRIDYSDPLQPAVSVRLQELFGMKKTPALAGGRVQLLMDILSPAMRTVQKTSDLESFWRESYFLVRKDMRGRYPKHDWPEDPTVAVAHRGVRRALSHGQS